MDVKDYYHLRNETSRSSLSRRIVKISLPLEVNIFSQKNPYIHVVEKKNQFKPAVFYIPILSTYRTPYSIGL